MSPVRYSFDHLCFLEAAYSMFPLEVVVEKFNRHFGTNRSLSSIRACLRNHKITSWRTGRFEKGHESWNAGLAGNGVCKRNSGTFRKGNVPGNVREMGAERVCSKDGYVLVKVAEGNPYTGAKTRFKAKHLVIWESHNGPLPEGCVIRFRDGDCHNFDIDNLICLTRAEHVRLTTSGYGEALPEVKPLLENLARLAQRVAERSR